MTTINSNPEILDFAEGERPLLPSGLNTLTILTFIGCGIGFLSAIYSFMTIDTSYKKLVEMQDKLETLPPMVRNMVGPEALAMAKKSVDNKLPILLLTIVGVVLCVYGAIEMRKLKKQGFILWIVGEVLPVIGGGIFLGAGMFGGLYLFMLIFPAIFIILYSVQKKYLIY